MTISTTIWFFVGGLIIIAVYSGIKVYWGNNSLGGLSIAVGVGLSSISLFRRLTQKDIVMIEIQDKSIINIFFDDKLRISAPISDLKKIFTIHYANNKADVQAEIIFNNGKIDLYDAGNYKNKETFDNLIKYFEKEFKFTYKKAPMSLRWSKHYVEYTNPLYNE